MQVNWSNWWLLAQDAAADAAPAVDGAAADGAPAGGGGLLDVLFGIPWLPFVVIAVMFYMLLIRPEKRKRDEHTKLLGSLKVNDRIVTIGGIVGIVVSVGGKNPEEVTIRVDENNNTKMRVLRSAVSRVLESDNGEKSDSI